MRATVTEDGLARAAAVADPTDEVLLRRFVAGEAAAFTTLVTRHQERVYAVCLRYFRDHADAQDAAQETFVVLYRRAETFVGSARFSTWLYRVAVNVCNDLARRRARRPQPDGRDPLAVAQPGADLIEQLELDLVLRGALATLNPDYREAVVLHSVLGWPYADIAARAGVAVGTIKSRVHRGHAALAVALAELRTQEPSAPASPPSGDG